MPVSPAEAINCLTDKFRIGTNGQNLLHTFMHRFDSILIWADRVRAPSMTYAKHNIKVTFLYDQRDGQHINLETENGQGDCIIFELDQFRSELDEQFGDIAIGEQLGNIFLASSLTICHLDNRFVRVNARDDRYNLIDNTPMHRMHFIEAVVTTREQNFNHTVENWNDVRVIKFNVWYWSYGLKFVRCDDQNCCEDWKIDWNHSHPRMPAVTYSYTVADARNLISAFTSADACVVMRDGRIIGDDLSEIEQFDPFNEDDDDVNEM